jgi:hypothetical protein
MRYREARLAPPLDAFVECVWFLSAASPESPETQAEQRILPDGCVDLGDLWGRAASGLWERLAAATDVRCEWRS